MKKEKDRANASYADQRKSAIEEAAYALLVEKGYKATSMLEVARRAGASNETLYRWYSNKQGLFRSLVEANAAHITAQLDEALEQAGAPDHAVLEQLGVKLLSMVTSERAVTLNRAAVGDVHDTGTLGKALAEAGRDAVLPRIVSVMGQMIDAGLIETKDAGTAAEIWLSLLIGDLQIRLVTGAASQPTQEMIKARAMRAAAMI